MIKTVEFPKPSFKKNLLALEVTSLSTHKQNNGNVSLRFSILSSPFPHPVINKDRINQIKLKEKKVYKNWEIENYFCLFGLLYVEDKCLERTL